MPTNQYLPFATAAGANTLSAPSYAATGSLIGSGYVAGVADAMHVNTVLRQATVGVAGTAKFATDYGTLNCMDDGSPANFALALKSAIDALVKTTTPSGQIASFGRATPPPGWLECNGTLIIRTAYPDLFAAIGTNYGPGDGSTTFKLPDARGRVLRGWDNGAGIDSDSARLFGSSQEDAIQNIVGTLGMDDRAASLATGAFSADGSVSPAYGSTGQDDGTTVTFDASRVVRTATETRMKNIAVLVCIKT